MSGCCSLRNRRRRALSLSLALPHTLSISLVLYLSLSLSLSLCLALSLPPSPPLSLSLPLSPADLSGVFFFAAPPAASTLFPGPGTHKTVRARFWPWLSNNGTYTLHLSLSLSLSRPRFLSLTRGRERGVAASTLLPDRRLSDASQSEKFSLSPM